MPNSENLVFTQDTSGIESKIHLASILDHIKDAVWLLDANLQTVDVNAAACRLLGWQREQILGLSSREILSVSPGSYHSNLSNLVQYLQRSISEVKEVPFLLGVTLSPGNEHRIAVEGAAYPLTDRGQVVGAAAIFRPVSPYKKTEQLQADFISMASHSLRTPLMSIQASLDYVLEAKADEAKNKRLLENARSQSKRIATVLRELLDASQLASGKEISIRLQPVALKPLIEMVVRDFSILHPETPLTLKMTSTLPLISTDRLKTEIILRNLLNHAKRRSKNQDAIELTVDRRSQDVMISISDRGPSIFPEQHEQIFWHVYALEPDKGGETAPYEYIIGLFTTRRLVESLGGSIWAARPNSHGASINFTLPIRK